MLRSRYREATTQALSPSNRQQQARILGKHLFVMLIPLTLETLVWIVLLF